MDGTHVPITLHNSTHIVVVSLSSVHVLLAAFILGMDWEYAMLYFYCFTISSILIYQVHNSCGYELISTSANVISLLKIFTYFNTTIKGPGRDMKINVVSPTMAWDYSGRVFYRLRPSV